MFHRESMNGLAKCGCDCTICPTYKSNLRSLADRARCSAGWEKYLDIRLSPEKLRACDGCSVPDPVRKEYYLNCIIRKCAMVNKVEHCACCTLFPCEELAGIHSLQGISDRKDFIKVTGKKIPEVDYDRYIKPYTGLSRLSAIRDQMKEDKTVPYRKHSSGLKFAKYTSQGKDPTGLVELYRLLTGICREEGIHYARMQRLRKRREQLIRILWVMGRDGRITGEEDCLELEGETLLSGGMHSSYHVLERSMQEFGKHDVHCRVIRILGMQWLTPGGALRKEGWSMNLRFGASYHGKNLPGLVKAYTGSLLENFDDRAFRHFNRADMNVMFG